MMKASHPTTDKVDAILTLWHKERPDLNFDSTCIVGRLLRISHLMEEAITRSLAPAGLTIADFNILTALRRHGAPYQESPKKLKEFILMTSGAQTSRLDKLEQAGYIRRVYGLDDRRSILIQLTDEGFALINQLIESHLRLEASFLTDIKPKEGETLIALLRQLLATQEHLAK